jgi:hypothetical protein
LPLFSFKTISKVLFLLCIIVYTRNTYAISNPFCSLWGWAIGNQNIAGVKVSTSETLTPDERTEIRQILSVKDLELSERLEKAYEIYHAAFLRKVPEHQRETVRRLVENLNIIYSAEGNYRATAKSVVFPSELGATIIVWRALAHERAHVAQLARYFDGERFGLSQAIRMLATRFFGVETSYRMEKDSMQEEWEILHAVPKEIIEHCIESIENSRLPNDARKVYLRNLKNAHLSREEYIKAENRAFRYSRTAIFVDVATNWAIPLAYAWAILSNG